MTKCRQKEGILSVKVDNPLILYIWHFYTTLIREA